MGASIRQAVVLAGGRGTRLGDLTSETPKPLLHVAGRPFLEWLIDNLERHGIEEVIITVGYRPEAFEEWLGAYRGQLAISTFAEAEPLDTGGALTQLGSRLADVFYVLNGDTLFDVPLAALGTALTGPEVDMAIALRSVENTGRYGRISLDGVRVHAFAEKAGDGPGMINGGVYAVRRAVFDARDAPLSIERDVIPELVAEGRVTALPCDGFFIDIGVPETLRSAARVVPEWWTSRSRS